MLIKSKNNFKYCNKHQKLDIKAYIKFLIRYQSINIYCIWISYKKKIVSVCNIIFDKNKIWDGQSIQLSIKKIKKLDEAITIVKLLAESDKNIQLAEDKENIALIPIMCQADYKANNFDIFTNVKLDKQTKDKNLEWAKCQYLSLDPFILKAFLMNSINILVERIRKVDSGNKNLPVTEKNHHPKENKNLSARVFEGKNLDSFKFEKMIISNPKLQIEIDPEIIPIKSPTTCVGSVVLHSALAIALVN